MYNAKLLTMKWADRVLLPIVLLLICTVAGCGQANPVVVSQFEPLKGNEHLIYSKDKLVASVYRNKKTEQNLLFRTNSSSPKDQDDSGNEVFFTSFDNRPTENTNYLFEVDGIRGRVVRLAAVGGTYTITPDGRYIIYLDWNYTMEKKNKSEKPATRIVVISNNELSQHSEYVVDGSFTMDTQFPYFPYDAKRQTFSFRVDRDDHHIETFEGNLATKTVRSIAVSKDVEYGM